MMRMPARRVALIAALLWSGIAAAAAPQLTAAALQRLLQAAPQRDLRFIEVRESHWLEAPVQSSGIMRAGAAVLEKRVDQPRARRGACCTTGCSAGRRRTAARGSVQRGASDGAAGRRNAQRRGGRPAALDKDFRISVAGDERLWTVQLTPRRAEASRYLNQMDLQGAGARLQIIVILEARASARRRGCSTTMTGIMAPRGTMFDKDPLTALEAITAAQ